jgi:hypothetical protein|nr:hypothetical protein [uncultured Rhodopila sp.]
MTEMQLSGSFETPAAVEDHTFEEDTIVDLSTGSDGSWSETLDGAEAGLNRQPTLLGSRSSFSNVRKSLFRR